MTDSDKQRNVDAGLVIRWLEPDEITASWDEESCRLTVHVGEETTEDVHVGLAFPVSNTDRFIDLCDEDNKSIGMLRSMQGLEAETLGAIRAALAMRYMIPAITRVHGLSETSPFVLEWDVETSRGRKVFHTESPRESVKHQSNDCIRITDLSGNHYDLVSIAALDEESRAILHIFL